MGYEIKIHVGEWHNRGEFQHFIEIASLDLCKPGTPNLIFEESDPDVFHVFIWSGDGNTRLTEDEYGDKIKAVSIKRAIKEFKKLVIGNNPYRRFVIALAMLEAINNTFDEQENVVVAFYGH